MIAFVVSLLATVIILLSVGACAFLTGWVVMDPERSGIARRRKIDWACSSCNIWATAYVCRFWRDRARRRALGLVHQGLSPECRSSHRDLLVVDLHDLGEARDVEQIYTVDELKKGVS